MEKATLPCISSNYKNDPYAAGAVKVAPLVLIMIHDDE